jgi:hypothetical protein
MALPKKGTRKIRVDGKEYRWRIRSQPTYCQGAFGSPMTFAVECVRQPKRVLVVNTGLPRPDSWVTLERPSVSPVHVAEAIRRALRGGWRPESGGSAFMLKVDLFGLEQLGPDGKLRTRNTTRAHQ